MNIFLTGGSGFIGRNFIELLDEKYNIFAPSHKELELLNVDAVRDYIKSRKIDIIIHTANREGNGSSKDMLNIVEHNTRIFFNIVRNSSLVKKIIHLGSGAEYGKQRDLAKVKEGNFDKYIPDDSYGFAKYICSKYIEKSKNIINLRLFGVYGKYEDYTRRFISNNICRALCNMSISINKNVFFDYLYVNDFLKIIELFINKDVKKRTYNICTGESIDFLTLAEIIRKIDGKGLPIKIKQGGFKPEYSGDNTLFLQECGGFNFTPIDKAIKELYNWYKDSSDIVLDANRL